MEKFFKYLSISLILSLNFYNNELLCQNQTPNTIKTTMVGTWISESDNNFKVVFSSNDTCKWYYQGVLLKTFNFFVSSNSPQCGYDVRTNPGEDFYLKLVDPNDNSENCYEILGVDSQSLSISSIDLGVWYFYFQRQ